MASFDIIDAAGHGYTKAWQERAYLARLAVVPLLVKFTCLVVILAMGYEDNLLRQGLILIPAFFMEGWLLAHAVRLFSLGERWPFAPTGDPEKDQRLMLERTRGIMGCILMYALLKFVQTGTMALVFHYGSLEDVQAARGEVRFEGALMAIILAAAWIWAFRLAFIYIPLAVNVSVYGYLKMLRGYATSFYLIGTWLLCFVPALLVLSLITGLALSPFGTMAEVPMAVSFGVTFFQVALDTLIAVVSTIATTWALMSIASRASGR